MAKRDLVRLLVRLYGDPRLQEKLARSADRTMKAAKLSKKERELLASGDVRAIGEYLGKESAKTNLAGKTDIVRVGTTDIVRAATTDIVRAAKTDIVRAAKTDIVRTAIRKPKAKPAKKKPSTKKPKKS